MIKNIVVTINNVNYTFTEKEARELYEDLRKFFERTQPPQYTLPGVYVSRPELYPKVWG